MTNKTQTEAENLAQKIDVQLCEYSDGGIQVYDRFDSGFMADVRTWSKAKKILEHLQEIKRISRDRR